MLGVPPRKTAFRPVLVGILVGLAGCGQPILNVRDASFAPANRKVSLGEVADAILGAAQGVGWWGEVTSPGHIVLTKSWNIHSATVDVSFNTEHFNVQYRSSENLDYTGSAIHPAYNDAVWELRGRIERALVPSEYPPGPNEVVIESYPLGARVELAGRTLGTTPLRQTYPAAYFRIGRTIFTKRLPEAISVVLYKDGYAPKPVLLTRGPFVWQSLNGQTRFLYYLLDHQYFVQLDPLPSAADARTAEPEQRSTSMGTCFAVSPKGLVLTAFHVVQGASAIRVHFPNREAMLARVHATNPSNDLALLVVDSSTTAHLPLAAPRSSRLGQSVFTIGYPAVQVLGAEPKYTDGTISALSGVAGDASLLQISVPIQPGNSGGPLVNERGEVVGIITSSAAIAAFMNLTGTLPQNVNWAVKAEYAAALFKPARLEGEPSRRETIIEAVRMATCAVIASP